MNDARTWLSVQQIAEHLGCGTRPIYTAIEKRELKAAPINGRGDFRIKREWLDEWMARSGGPVVNAIRRTTAMTHVLVQVHVIDRDGSFHREELRFTRVPVVGEFVEVGDGSWHRVTLVVHTSDPDADFGAEVYSVPLEDRGKATLEAQIVTTSE